MTTEQTEELVRWMDENPDVALASPALVDASGESLNVERRFPSVFASLLLFLRLHLLFTKTLKARLFSGPFAEKTLDSKSADWILGAAMIARRSAVEEVGPMSDEFPMYGEDVEWCWRFKEAGWKIGVVNRLSISHIGGTSTTRSYEVSERIARRFYSVAWVALELMIAVTEAFHPGRSTDERDFSLKRSRALFNILLSRP